MFEEVRFWKSTCPTCGSEEIRRSRRTPVERLLKLLPYRCEHCNTRWYRLKAIAEKAMKA